MTVSIKPLEWNPFRAETPFGYYRVDVQSADELKGKPPFLLSGSHVYMSRHQTLEAARSSAQTDYETRIRAALAHNEQAEPVRHPLSDAQIEEYWPGADPAEIREQFDALMRQLGLVWHRSFPQHHKLFAGITAERAKDLPARVADLKTALAGLPKHWDQWQWKADEKPVFGERYVRSVYGDNGHGMGRQVIAAVPADKHYFGTVADFIAAANPDTLRLLIARLDELEAAPVPEQAEPVGYATEAGFKFFQANETASTTIYRQKCSTASVAVYSTHPPTPAPEQASVPDGFTLVPVEPTLAMRITYDEKCNELGLDRFANLNLIWPALLAASPRSAS
ncbi:hypothetical protein QBK99_11150 [Corticibacterium sp. UT-5YL-CI-8]|nr:hypothetical protein [Tianweitania sp. UT-5YL-CI-8]